MSTKKCNTKKCTTGGDAMPQRLLRTDAGIARSIEGPMGRSVSFPPVNLPVRVSGR